MSSFLGAYHCSLHRITHCGRCPECAHDAARNYEASKAAKHEATMKAQKKALGFTTDVWQVPAKAAKAVEDAHGRFVEGAIKAKASGTIVSPRYQGVDVKFDAAPFDPSRAPPIDVYGDSAELLPTWGKDGFVPLPGDHEKALGEAMATKELGKVMSGAPLVERYTTYDGLQPLKLVDGSTGSWGIDAAIDKATYPGSAKLMASIDKAIEKAMLDAMMMQTAPKIEAIKAATVPLPATNYTTTNATLGSVFNPDAVKTAMQAISSGTWQSAPIATVEAEHVRALCRRNDELATANRELTDRVMYLNKRTTELAAGGVNEAAYRKDIRILRENCDNLTVANRRLTECLQRHQDAAKKSPPTLTQKMAVDRIHELTKELTVLRKQLDGRTITADLRGARILKLESDAKSREATIDLLKDALGRANEKIKKVDVFDDLVPIKPQAPDSLFGGPQRKNSGVVDWPRS